MRKVDRGRETRIYGNLEGCREHGHELLSFSLFDDLADHTEGLIPRMNRSGSKDVRSPESGYHALSKVSIFTSPGL